MTPPAAPMPALASRRGHWPFGLALILLALPNLLFLLTHLASGIVAFLCAGAMLAAVGLVLRDLGRAPEPLDRRLFGVSLVAGFALCLLGGEAHMVFANDDWLIRDAVLRDLVAESWPVGYRYQGDDTILRAPLGLYLGPALVGKALGLHAAHGSLLVQNGLLFGGLVYGFGRIVRPLGASLAVVAIFLLFSGWDVVGTWLVGRPLTFGVHLDQWVRDLQFSSHLTQVFWVPNHAASGWGFVGAYLLWRRGALSAASLVVVFGLCVFWSPLSMMGALPFLILALLAGPVAGLDRPASVAVVTLAALGLIPVALYLKVDATRIAHGLRVLDGDFLFAYGLFLVLELLPFWVLLSLKPHDNSPASTQPMQARMRWELPLVAILLLTVPLYRLGSTDFVMRASIPALALLALRCGAHVVSLTGRNRATALGILAVGAVTPLYEIGRALIRPPFAISDCSLLEASGAPPNDGPLYHYVARLDPLRESVAGLVLVLPTRFVALGARRPCWPDHDRFETPPAAP